MNKEELLKEAIQYAVDYPTSYGKGYKHKDLRIAYLAGAEPREKRIADLEKENAELKERLFKVENAYKRKSEAEWRLNDLYHKVLTDFANAEKCSREYFTRYTTMLDFYIKAKDILQRLMENQPTPSSMYEEIDLIEWRAVNKEAEQFLKEE